jgi:DNA-binding NarL/FixJ family response regulator
MAKPVLYDIVESPAHPDLAALSHDLGFDRVVFGAQRKAIGSLKHRPPAVVVADFFFGYGNNYAGANVSNLDVLLRSLQRFAPEARVIVLADRNEIRHVDKLAALFELHAVVAVPATRSTLEAALT